jgi:uncharacterized protein
MSNANVKFVESLYAAFKKGDIATIVGAFAPDATWEVTGRREDYPTLGIRKGRSGGEEFFRTVAETQEVLDFSPREFYPAGDKVFVLGHYAWRIRKTGRKVETNFIHIFTVKDGKVMNFLEFTDTAKFAEAFRG